MQLILKFFSLGLHSIIGGEQYISTCCLGTGDMQSIEGFETKPFKLFRTGLYRRTYDLLNTSNGSKMKNFVSLLLIRNA